MNGNTHLINEQVINLNLPTAINAYRAQEEVRNVYWSKLLPEIERIFDELSGPGELLILDSLEIDIGLNFELEVNPAIISSLREQIFRQVNQLRQTQRTAIAVPGRGKAATAPEAALLSGDTARLAVLARFLETGSVEWWADIDEEPIDFTQLLEELSAEKPYELVQLLVRLRDEPYVFTRLAHRAGSKTFRRILAVLAGGQGLPLVHRWARLLLSFIRPALQESQLPAYVMRAWKLAAVTELAALQADPGKAEILIAALLKNMPAEISDNTGFAGETRPAGKLYRLFAAPAGKASAMPAFFESVRSSVPDSSERDMFLPLLRLLLEVEASVPSPVLVAEQWPVLKFFFRNRETAAASWEGFLRWRRSEPVLAAPGSLPALAAQIAAYTGWDKKTVVAVIHRIFLEEYELPVPAAHPSEKVIRFREILEVLLGVPASPRAWHSTEAGPLLARVAREIETRPNGDMLLKEDPVSETVKTGKAEAPAEIPEPLLDEKKTPEKKKEELPEQGLAAPYAGLVLLGPFLPAFFRILELTNGKTFADAAAQHKAVFLLHYLATGDTEAEEQDLLLHKILCGMEPDMPVPKTVRLSDTEKEHAEELLSEAAQRWEKLRSRSGSMIRPFLSRNGRITINELGYLLRVERTAIDILIDTLPWGISVIRAPWMKRLLQTEW